MKSLGIQAILLGVVPSLLAGSPQITLDLLTLGCIENIRATLAECGCTLSDVVKSTVWLKSREDFPGFNAVYSEYFQQDPPARTGLVNDFLIDIRIEIECIAMLPDH